MAFCVLVLWVMLPVAVLSRSTGAPDVSSVCTGMVPQHSGTLSTAPSPFSITTSVSTYDYRSTTINVTLSGASTSFKGFLVQARSIDPSRDQTVPLGDFVVIQGVSQMTCNSSTGSALTHVNSQAKNNLVLEWNARAGINPGHIEFLVTFVQSYTVYYVKQRSSSVTEQNTGATGSTARPTTAPPLPAAAFNEADCGVTRGCFRSPDSCSGDCRYFISWSYSNGQVELIMSADTPGYVAMGLSNDQKMGSDSVAVCANGALGLRVEVGENSGSGKFYSRDRQATAPQLTAVSYSGGRLTCQFTLSENQPLPGGKALKDQWNLLMAKGNLVNDDVSRHSLSGSGFPVITQEQVSFRDTKNYGGASAPKLIKAHGSMMIIAWILCASSGIMMARYYKKMWPKSKPCGKLVWFQVHRILMITNLLLTVAAFIIIFVHAGGYSSGLKSLPDSAHPILGITVTVLVIVNPIMAIFRCAPDDDNRPIFNWAHWAVGTTALLLAVATVSIGVRLRSATSFDWLHYIIIGWAIFTVLVVIVLEINQRRTSRNQEEYEMHTDMKKGTGVQQSKHHSEQGGGQCRCITLGLYIAVTLAVVVALVICIAAY